MINVERVELSRISAGSQLQPAIASDAIERKEEEEKQITSVVEGKDDSDDEELSPDVINVPANQRRKGVLALLGSAHGLAAWKNPAFNGLVWKKKH